jgi:hypothetical protein
MQRWCRCRDVAGEVRVEVRFLDPETSRTCRQDLEDAAWDLLQPVFGRKGAR